MAAVLARRVVVDLGRDRRARADDRHLAAQDVDQVGDLVERGAAQEAAGAGDPRVVAGDDRADPDRVGAGDHRAQLQHLELARRPGRRGAGGRSTGPRLPSLIAIAATSRTGERTSSASAAMAMSKALRHRQRRRLIAFPRAFSQAPGGAAAERGPRARRRSRRWSSRSSGRCAAAPSGKRPPSSAAASSGELEREGRRRRPSRCRAGRGWRRRRPGAGTGSGSAAAGARRARRRRAASSRAGESIPSPTTMSQSPTIIRRLRANSPSRVGTIFSSAPRRRARRASAGRAWRGRRGRRGRGCRRAASGR